MTLEEYSKLFREIPEPVAKPLWVRDFKAITTHIRGNKENDLIGKRRPNEPIEVQAYRKENYRAVTRAPFNQAITNLVRVLAHSGVDVKFPEDLEQEFQDTNYNGKSLMSFFESETLRKMIEMANGFLVWWPFNVGDETQRVEMRPIFVKPENIHHYREDVFCFLSDEKSEVTFNRKKRKIGNVYYIILKDELVRRVQTGNKTDDDYVFEPYYSNPTGLIYPLVLGGDVVSDEVENEVERKREDVEYYTSFFSSAVPFADECISQFSDHQGTLVSSSFPLREVEQMNCNAEGCFNGKINTGEKGVVICDTCHGTGKLPMSPSPYGVLVRPKRANNIDNPNGATSSEPVMRFISPPVDILTYQGSVWEKQLKLTKEALNLVFIDEAQSGIAKETDREDKVATLDKIGRHLYNYLLKNSIQIIHKFYYPDSEWVFVRIILPSTFVPKTQVQVEAEVKSFRELSVPDIILAPKMREMMRKSVNNDPYEMKIYDIGAMMDPIYLRTFLEKNQMLATGVIDSETLQRSNLIPSVLRQYANEKPDFMELGSEVIATEVSVLVEELITSDPNTI
jgi:hypothetical protein